MVKRTCLLCCLLLLAVSGQSALKQIDESQIVSEIYSEITLENFEKNSYDTNSLEIEDKSLATVFMVRAFPAPVYGSVNYLSWATLKGTNKVISLKFKTEIKIKRYCRSLSLWVFATHLHGDLAIMLEDSRNQTHILNFGRLKFRGWRKLTLKIPANVIQKDLSLGKNDPIRLIKLMYNPGRSDRIKKWNIFFLDDLTASVRPRYLLPEKK